MVKFVPKVTSLKTYFYFLDGLGKNNSNYCTSGSFSLRYGQLGTSFNCRAIIRDAQLGDGVQEMVSGL